MAPVTALAGGVTRSWGRPAGPLRPPAWRAGAGLWSGWQLCARKRLARCREWWCGRLAWIILVQAPVRAVRGAAGGLRVVGGDAAVMAEQATSGLAGLLRQLRAGAR